MPKGILGASAFFDYCVSNLGCCAKAIGEDNCDCVLTFYSDLCDELSYDLIVEFFDTGTRFIYLIEELIGKTLTAFSFPEGRGCL